MCCAVSALSGLVAIAAAHSWWSRNSSSSSSRHQAAVATEDGIIFTAAAAAGIEGAGFKDAGSSGLRTAIVATDMTSSSAW